MRTRHLLVTLVASGLTISGCGGAGAGGDAEATAPSGEYVVERSVTNGVETVRTVSGSLWEQGATLVEELAIGDERGTESSLFGTVSAAWATEDRVYVVDSQVPVVRAFSLEGVHLLDIGRPGQGPGEYLMPMGVLVLSDGSIAVAEAMSARINLYDSDGQFVGDWPLASQKAALGLALGSDGQIYTRAWSLEAGRMGIQEVGPEGLIGDIVFPPEMDFEPNTVTAGKDLEMILPFSPGYTWAFAPGGEMIAGTGDRYRFEIHRPGAKVMIVERNVAAIGVNAGEADFRARVATSALRVMSPDGAVNRGDLPDHKPFYTSFFPDHAGRTWVVRSAPGRPDPECRDADLYVAPRLLMVEPSGRDFETDGKPGRWDDTLEGRCWTETYTFDLFDTSTGDFLGSVSAPEPGFRIPLHADDRVVLAAVSDDLGTVRLKKYRLQID